MGEKLPIVVGTTTDCPTPTQNKFSTSTELNRKTLSGTLRPGIGVDILTLFHPFSLPPTLGSNSPPFVTTSPPFPPYGLNRPFFSGVVRRTPTTLGKSLAGATTALATATLVTGEMATETAT